MTDDPDWVREIFAPFDDVYQLPTDNLKGAERREIALGNVKCAYLERWTVFTDCYFLTRKRGAQNFNMVHHGDMTHDCTQTICLLSNIVILCLEA